MRVETVDGAALATHAAGLVADAARAAVADRGRFTVAFSGGRTPAGMLAALARADLPWDHVHVLQADERAAPDGHADRNATLLVEQLLASAPIPPANVWLMPAADADLDAAAARYAAVLREVAGDPAVLGLVHLGLGADGHTASLVPGDPVVDVTGRDVAVTGEYAGRRRLTLTLPALNRARSILWLVSGADRADALARLVRGDPSIPAGRVARSQAVVVTDVAAPVTPG